jgi:multicomponent Na+:H+ antiporter subunit D
MTAEGAGGAGWLAAAPALAVFVPLAAALIAFLVGDRARTVAGLLGSAATALVVAVVAWQVIENGPARYPMGGWGAPAGIDLYVDGISAMLLLTTAGVGLLVAAFAWRDFEADHDERAPRAFWPLWLFVLSAMNALYVSADIFNLYVTLELLGIAAVGLVLVGRGADALIAGTRYLLVAFTGSMAYLMGVALAYAQSGTLDLYALADGAEGRAMPVALALMTAGLLLKSGVFPLHFWLPAAHAIAPSPVSPLLSGLVVKASLYLVFRLWLQAFPESASMAGAMAIGLLGVGGILWGSFEALRQVRLKRLIAYSTVAQLGYLLLLVPLGVAALREGDEPGWGADAWFGAVYLVVAHAVAKAALFMAAGLILRGAGTDRMEDLRGLTDAFPMTTFAFGLATFALVGLPPSAGFSAKWHLITASFESGQWWWAPVIVGGSLLTAAYLLRATWFFCQRGPTIDLRLPPHGMEALVLVTAALAVALGLRTVEVYDLIALGSPFGSGG